MDINSKWRPSTNSNSAELEKFSRRLIHAVSRMLLLEKRDEEEVWEGLKKETGFDCQELWFRMRALTIKKLDRLLEVEDQVDRLPKAARMSITNWLLFDTVLVHQNFNVIGMTETSTEDRQVLIDLFDLVEKYKLEYLAGEQLADAWSAATIEYNKNNRQCTPMLLQRRWYQLRLATRERFYEFWFNFKGVATRIEQAAPYKPTPLQTRIARSYKHLVVTAFSPWEELIKNRLVILREEFAVKGMQKEDVIDENSPDVVCIEQNVETIDLDNDSDVELEYRKSQHKENKDSTTIKIKQEPKDTYEMDIDESVPYQNRQDKISYFAEAVMKATTLELEEIDSANSMDLTIADTQDNDDVIITDDDLSDREVAVTSSLAESRMPSLMEENNINSAIENQSDIVSDNIIGRENTVADENEVIETVHLKFESDVEIVQANKESEQVLPQITNIFGGVNDSAEALSTISMLAVQITDPENKAIIGKASDPNESAIELSSDSVDKVIEDITENKIVDAPSKPTHSEDNSSVVHNLNTEIDIKPETNKSLWFGDLSNDMDFVDDGIQWVDDGIAYEDDVSQTDWIKTEIDLNTEENEQVKTEDDETNHNKFDEKLLMIPAVSTVKLDDMGLLPIHLLNHVNNKCLIDIISCKSKLPIPKIDDIKSECNEEGVTDSIKKVKLSSYLLQKPRNRKYHPIQLCKNPDFNTRLKRLNVGFFSSSRNRLLFKSCQPVTIDVSKAFEDRLVDGTIYLEINGDDNTHKKNDIPESAQNNSVLPSAMPAQSLIDNTRGEIIPVKYNDMNIKPLDVPPQACQRNKTINLPDITEIRRINQNLLTAEVTPIQIKDYDTEIEKTQLVRNNLVNTVHSFKVFAGPASRKRVAHIREQNKINNSISNILTDTDLQTAQNNPLRKKKCNNKFVRWKPREIRPEVPWVINHNGHYTSDTLLALDSLNKMLCLLTEGDKALSRFESKKKKKKVSEDQDKTGHQLKPSPDDKNPVKNDDADEVQVISETLDSSETSNKIKNPVYRSNNKKQRHVICCWARERITRLQYPRKRRRKHTCPFPLCLCCCKFDLLHCYKKAREENAHTDIQKPPISLNSLDNEADYDGKQENVAVEKDADVAELIPIQKTNKIDPESSLNETNSAAEVILCSDKTALSNPVSDKPLPCEISSQDEVENYVDTSFTLGAEVSIMTSKSTVTNEEINNSSSIKYPRIRVKHSVGKIFQHVDCEEGPTRFKDKAIDTDDVSSIAKVDDFITTSKGDSTEVNVDSMHPKTTSSNHAETTPTSINNLYLCVEPLVSQASEIVTNKRKTVFSHRRVQLSPNISDITFEVAPEKRKIGNGLIQMAQKGSNQKMIYLNSKQIAELPSDNPIHLGKNKILLTTFKFPSNFKAFESYQRNLKQTMALPKGILLTLLPNGRLTYKINVKAQLSNSFLAVMPQLIEAIQQQIDSASPFSTENMPSVNSLTNHEVICLSDEESNDVVNTSDMSINNSQKQLQMFGCLNNINNSNTPNVENSNSQTKTNVVSSKENMTAVDIEKFNENVNLEHIITSPTEASSMNTNSGEINYTINDSTLPEKNREFSETPKESTEEKVNENISNEKSNGEHIPSEINSEPNSSEITCTVKNSTSPEKNRIFSETSKENTEEKIIENISIEKSNSEHTPSEVNSEPLVIPNANITNEEINENKCNEKNSSKTKNILSDLMAMSGILLTENSQESSSDVIPSDTLVQLPIQKDLPVPNHVPISQFQGIPQLHYVQPPIQFTPNLSHSTENSNAGLRALFSDNTEIYTPLTSLSELKYACSNNASFFKLDLDTKSLVPINVCMKSIVGKGSLKPIKSNKNKSIIKGPTIDLTDDDDTRHNENDNIKNDSEDANNTLTDNTIKQAKPLILVHAGNVQDKLKIHKRLQDSKKIDDNTRLRQKRKQEHMKPFNPPCGELTGQTTTIESPDSSSDEEPLANLVIKKRRNENYIISDNIDLPMGDGNSVSDTLGDTVVDSKEETDIDTAEHATDFGAGSSTDTPELVMEYLDEELLQEDEDCILGV